MKKLLSVLLAVSMLLAMGSGMVLFGANAETVKMPIPGFDAFTVEELSQFAVNVGAVGFEKDGDKTIVTLSDAQADSWGIVQVDFATALTADTAAMNPLVNGKSFFGDVDLSNKSGFKFKIVNTGAEGTTPFNGELSFCFGSSHRKIKLDYKGVKPDSQGYYVVDWSQVGIGRWGKEFVWPSEIDNVTEAYYMGMDMVKLTFVVEADTTYSFYLDDFHALGNADTVELGKAIKEATDSGVVAATIIAAAEGVYMDPDATQAQVDQQVEILNTAIEEAISGFQAAKTTLNNLLNEADALDYFNPESPNYEAASAADLVYSNDESTLAELKAQIATIRLLIAADTMEAEVYEVFAKAINVWEYNYAKKSYNAFSLVLDQAWALYADDAAGAVALIEEAYANLVSAPVRANTANFFEGWTTEDVNAVVEANSDKLCDSIGNGLNEENVWNSGDFTNNTIFEADNNFSMTALVDFAEGSMGWKNMDRTNTLNGGVPNGPYPTMNVAGLSASAGIRFKLEVDGSVERLLIGLSNCADGWNREQYALNIKPEYVDADGYINIPFSYFEKAWWSESFTVAELENVLVFIVEAYGVTADTTVTISDVTGYLNLSAVSDEMKAKLDDIVEKLRAFDIDGRYADLITAAEALTDNDYDVDYQKAYDDIFAVLKEFKDPDSAIIDVPGYSIYTQEELDQFSVRSGTCTAVKEGDGVKFTYKDGYWMANATYADNGFEDGDVAYGAVNAINGKTFIDMLGGYSLADIAAFRFKIEKGNDYVVMAYKDGVGLWDGMVSKKHTVYINNGYFTFKTSDISTAGFDNWYGTDKFTVDQIREMTKFILADFTANQNRVVYGWQVIVYYSIDRSPLKEALATYADLGVEGYDEAMEVYYNSAASEEDIAAAAEKLIASATPAIPDAPTAAEITDTSVTLNAAADNLEYRLGEDGEWTTDTVFEGLTPNTEYTFYARTMASDLLPASEASEPLTVTTLKTALIGEALIVGDMVYGETLTVDAEVNADEYEITWYRDGSAVATGAEYVISADDIGSTLHVILTNDSFSGEVVSFQSAVITKAKPVILGAPESVGVFLGEALADVALTGIETDAEGTWAWETPDVIPSYEQSGSSFKAVFTPALADCYESITLDITVIVDSNTEYGYIYDEATGIRLGGEFALNKEVETAFGDIVVGDAAYLAILRAARGSETDNNLMLFKNVALNSDNAYVGTLELSAYIGEYHAGENYTLWYFADGEVRSAEGMVDSDGVLIVSGVIA